MSVRLAEHFVKSGYCSFFQSFLVAFKSKTQPEKSMAMIENKPFILTAHAAIIPFKTGKSNRGRVSKVGILVVCLRRNSYFILLLHMIYM